MSWLTPVLREIAGDSGMTSHKNLYLQNGATPNLVVSLDKAILPEQFTTWVKLFKEKEPTGFDVYKTMYLGGGADAKIVGNSLAELDFKVVQGAGETRIAAAGGVPPVIVGLSEGLQAATYSNYGQARRRFADLFARPEWRNFAGSMQTVITTPSDARLWYDSDDIAFLREDAKDRAEILSRNMLTIESGIRGGYTPDSVVKAVAAEDLSLLQHTGLYSVQLQPPQPDGPPKPPAAAPIEPKPSEPARDALLMRMLELSERRAAVPPVINVTTPDVNVTTPDVNVTIERGAVEVTNEAAVINVTTPEVRNEVNVEPTPVTITNEVSVEPTPLEVRNEVNVNPTPVEVHNEVSVEPTPVSITNEIPEQRPVTKTVQRDGKGQITRITEEPS
jgi:hypothetical protein